MEKTPARFNGKIYQNPVPTEVMKPGSFFRVLKKWFQKHPGSEPQILPGPFHTDLKLLNSLPKNSLRATWLGHSSTILEIDGSRILTDPLWYQRASPASFMGPKRYFDNPISIDDLPLIDFILLSHDHYDHLDRNAIITLLRKNIPLITMKGVGKRLLNWGLDRTLITELDWWEDLTITKGIKITALPSRHFSGRSLTDRFTTLWGSFAIKGPEHQIYYGADSGYYEGFKLIGDTFGPFDLTLLEIGAYNEDWAAIHMGPEAAVQAHLDLKGKLLMPLHWGTFTLAFHPWKEPVERVIKAASFHRVPLLLPIPGQTWNITDGPYISQWWEAYD